jgi:DNA-binding transcriptional ArsR family regulator
MRRDVFQAISDPTRRAIISLLAKNDLNLNAIAGYFEVSRPAISKQVRILAECGLITIKQEGRERICEARLGKLNEVADWVEQYAAFWNKKLDALEEYLQEVQSPKQKKDLANRRTKKKR